MANLDTLSTGRALGLAALVAGVNSKDLRLTVSAATGLAPYGVSTSEQTGRITLLGGCRPDGPSSTWGR